MTDYEEIQNLIARYADAVNRRDFDALAEVFAPDAVWDVTGGTKLRHEGAQVVPGIRKIVEMGSFLVQIHSPAIIQVDGDRATSRLTVLEVGELPNYGMRFEQYGTYDDILRKSEGQWRFAERRFTTLNFKKYPLMPDTDKA